MADTPKKIRIRKPKVIDTTGKIKCTRCKVWKLISEYSPKRKNTEGQLKKYCNHCLGVSTNYRNKKKIIKINVNNLSDEEKKDILNEVNNVSD